MNDTQQTTIDADQYCTACQMTVDHTTPVAASHSSTGTSGCPECLNAAVVPIVEQFGDERTITGGYIPSGQRDDVIEVTAL